MLADFGSIGRRFTDSRNSLSREIRRIVDTADHYFTPIRFVWFYIFNLTGFVLLNYVYYLINRNQLPPNIDWFRAAVLDNYAFMGILVYPFLIAYVQLTQDTDVKFRDMVRILAGRRILQAAVDGKQSLVPVRLPTKGSLRELDRIEASARDAGERVGASLTLFLAIVLIGLAIAASAAIPVWYLVALGFLHVLALPLVYKIGARLMRLVYYGQVVYRYGDYQVKLEPVIGHVDRAGGLKPLGDYFLGQGYRICLLSGFLIVGALFLVTNTPIHNIMHAGETEEFHQYLQWTFICFALFVVTMQLSAVVLPMWRVHERMVQYRRDLLGQAAVMTRSRQRLVRLDPDVPSETAAAARREDRLRKVERWLADYDALPTWPVRYESFRTFWVMWSGSIAAAVGMLIRAIVPD